MNNSSQLPFWTKGLAVLVYILFGSIFPWLVLGAYGDLLEAFTSRIVIFLGIALVGSQVLFRLYRQWSIWTSFVFTLLLYSSIFQITTFFSELSTYPLSLGWSETSRYYYASLFLPQRIYAVDVPPSVLHPTRYLMQAVPFLIENSPLWLHRLWQVFLWVSISMLGAYSLVWRLNRSPRVNPDSLLFDKQPINNTLIKLAIVMWAFLFFFQGPVYYHLMVMVILVLWGFDRERFWKSLFFVLLASLWAGISRLNWFPMPGLLASALYFLEVRIEKRSIWRYLWKPFLWTASGILAALLAQQLYIIWSDNPPGQFTSSFTSDLLWYRLLPNPTYRIGILPSIILVSLPLFGAMVLMLYRRWSRYHIIRLLGLGTILLVLFSGGVIVSLKIGGGSNLHNLDAYLVMLLVVGSYISLGCFPPDYINTNDNWVAYYPINRFLITAIVALPVGYAISSGGQLPNPNYETAFEAIQSIQDHIQNLASEDSEVLFISQRHLLTFDKIHHVRLVPDFEKVFLMEMAMSGSESYLNDFYSDIESRRFDLIITDPLKIQYQGASHSFGEENDAWVSKVSEPVLCYYEPIETLSDVEIQILEPRNQSCE